MGANWSGGMGANWFGANWFGANWASSSGGAVPIFAMRADSPLAEQTVTADLNAKFRDRDWDADFVAQLILPEFLATNWRAGITMPAPPPVTQQMIDKLLLLAVTERPEALGEIVQQHQNFQTCWMQLLNIDQASHPATFFFMKIVARVGEFVMISLKRENQNKSYPRPSQVCPTLYPPVPVPGHASYPAGHAIIGYLTSKCLATDLVPQHADALDKLAERCAFNRVIAGLHFERDIEVGAQIGTELYPYISACAMYGAALAVAQQEWT